MNKGGKRIGAGRKPSPVGEKRVTLSIRISPRAKERLAEVKERTGMSAGALLEEYIEILFARSQK